MGLDCLIFPSSEPENSESFWLSRWLFYSVDTETVSRALYVRGRMVKTDLNIVAVRIHAEFKNKCTKLKIDMWFCYLICKINIILPATLLQGWFLCLVSLHEKKRKKGSYLSYVSSNRRRHE
jgi:hypothetical protein